MTKKNTAALINDTTIAVIQYLDTQRDYFMINGGDFNAVFCSAIAYITGFAPELTVEEAFNIARSCSIKFLHM